MISALLFCITAVSAAIPYGIQQNFPISSMPSGWKKHYDEPYSHKTELENSFPNGWTECFAWGGYRAGSTTLMLVAFGHVNTGGQQTYSRYTANLDNGVYFYRFNGKSMGFADSSNVYLNTADVNGGNLRLSWHLQGSGGYRIGSIKGLDYNNDYYKTAWYGPCDGETQSPTLNPTSGTPTLPPSLSPSLAPSNYPTYSPTDEPTTRPTFEFSTSRKSGQKQCLGENIRDAKQQVLSVCSVYSDLAACEANLDSQKELLKTCQATSYPIMLLLNEGEEKRSSALVAASSFGELRQKAAAAFAGSEAMRTNAYFQYWLDSNIITGMDVSGVDMMIKVQNQADFEAAIATIANGGGAVLAMEIV